LYLKFKKLNFIHEVDEIDRLYEKEEKEKVITFKDNKFTIENKEDVEEITKLRKENEELKKRLEISNFLIKMMKDREISDEINKKQKDEFDILMKKQYDMTKEDDDTDDYNNDDDKIGNLFQTKKEYIKNNPINEMFKEIKELKK
jgi:hypothetical protein